MISACATSGEYASFPPERTGFKSCGSLTPNRASIKRNTAIHHKSPYCFETGTVVETAAIVLRRYAPQFGELRPRHIRKIVMLEMQAVVELH